MRNSKILFLVSFLGWGMAMLIVPSLASGQMRGADDVILEIGKMGMDEQGENPSVKMEQIRVDREIKYVSGEDKLWFTDDDAVYEHYQIERDAQTGKVLKSLRYLPGKDGEPFTYDDVLKEFTVFEYGFDGDLVKETVYDGQNAKKYARVSTSIYDYDAKGRKTKRISSYPGKKEQRTMLYSYDGEGNLVRDVESLAGKIEKYHRFEYDRHGQAARVMEYHVNHDGQGADGEWFTPDDVVSSTKESFYNLSGSKAEDNKYIAPGSDGKWFTKDDQMQYYVLFEPQEAASL